LLIFIPAFCHIFLVVAFGMLYPAAPIAAVNAFTLALRPRNPGDFPHLDFFGLSNWCIEPFPLVSKLFFFVCVFLMGNIAASDRLRMFSSIGQSQGFPDALWFAGHYLRLPFGQCVKAWLLRNG
jgi:hypothetical protein